MTISQISTDQPQYPYLQTVICKKTIN